MHSLHAGSAAVHTGEVAAFFALRSQILAMLVLYNFYMTSSICSYWTGFHWEADCACDIFSWFASCRRWLRTTCTGMKTLESGSWWAHFTQLMHTPLCSLISIRLKLFCFIVCLLEMCGLHWEQHEKTDPCSRQKRERCEFFCVWWMNDVDFFFLFIGTAMLTSLLSLSPVAIRGESVSRVSSLHRGEHAAVADETREAQDL